MKSNTKEFMKQNPYTMILLVLMVVVLLIFTGLKGNVLWTAGTWQGMIMQFPEYGLMAVGCVFTFLIGCIDMSFVMLGNFATICAVLYMTSHVYDGMSDAAQFGVIVVAFFIVIAIATIGGIINALLICKLGIPPVIATISMQMVWLGLSTGVTGGETLSLLDVPLYAQIGHTYVLGFLPFPLLVFIILFAISAFLLYRTTYGRQLYMCGSNLKAAKFSSINTDAMIIKTFIIGDIICCIGSMLMLSTLSSVKADNGESYVMTVVLILVLAGISPDGGIGKIGNLILSIFIVQIIKSSINMFTNLNTYVASFIYGAFLVVVLILSTYMDGGSFKFKKRIKKETKKTEPAA